MSTLEENFKYYLDNQEELVKSYNGSVIVIHDLNVAGAFDTNGEAYRFGVKTFGEGNFLMQRCSPGDKDHKVTYNSQVILV